MNDENKQYCWQVIINITVLLLIMIGNGDNLCNCAHSFKLEN